VPRHVAHAVHQALGATAVHMGAAGALKDGPQVECLCGVAMVMVDLHMGSKFGRAQYVEEGGVACFARAVVELEIGAALAEQVPHHGQDRRDANAARDKDRGRRGFGERKQIGPRQGGQQVAELHCVNHALRAAATFGVALDGDLPCGRVRRFTAQRVAAANTAGCLHGDVRTCREHRQGMALRMG